MANRIHRTGVMAAVVLVLGAGAGRAQAGTGFYIQAEAMERAEVVVLLGTLLLVTGWPYLLAAEPSLQTNVAKMSAGGDAAQANALADVPASSWSLDKSGFAYSLAAGYRFSPHFAVEAAYLDLGRSTYWGWYAVAGGSASVNLDLRLRGPVLSLTGVLPINDTWSLEGNAGAYFGGSKLKAVVTDGSGTPQVLRASGSHTSLLLGAGIVATFGERLAVRAGYVVLDKVAAVSGTDVDSGAGYSSDRISLGIRYSF